MENNYEKYDTIIIGAGPAGLTAAIYLARNNVNVLVIESYMPGGKLAEQSEISNYPGFSKISGADLAISFYKQAKDNDVKFLFDKVISLEKLKMYFNYFKFIKNFTIKICNYSNRNAKFST